MQRLASVGLGRREDNDAGAAGTGAARHAAGQTAGAASAPAPEGRTADPVSDYARRPRRRAWTPTAARRLCTARRKRINSTSRRSCAARRPDRSGALD